MRIQQFIKIFHIVEDLWLFPYFLSALPRSVKIDIWQAYRLDLFTNNYQNIPKVSRVVGNFADRHILAVCLDLVDINEYTRFIKISHMVEDIQRFSIFAFFASALSWLEKSDIW